MTTWLWHLMDKWEEALQERRRKDQMVEDYLRWWNDA